MAYQHLAPTSGRTVGSRQHHGRQHREVPIRVDQATAAGTGHRNEDRAETGSGWALVLDGASEHPQVRTGCVHGVSWLVDQLRIQLAAALGRGDGWSLPVLTAEAIAATRDQHSACDLANPDSPSATLAIVRADGDSVEILVLGDCAVVLAHQDGTVRAVTDDRVERLPGGRPYSLELVREHRNRLGGFWVASTAPDAAHQAVSTTVPRAALRSVHLVTDGVTRLVSGFGWSWEQLATALSSEGPGQVINQVRQLERAQPLPRGKPHDDATAVRVRL